MTYCLTMKGMLTLNNVDKVEDKIAKEQEFLELYKELTGEYN